MTKQVQTLHFNITKKDLENYAEFEELIQDYPLYAHASNLCKADIVLFAKLAQYEFGNEAQLKVTVQVS